MKDQPELFNHPRYRLNIYSQCILGQWPFQVKIINQIMTALYFGLMLSIIIPQIHVCISDGTIDTILSAFPSEMTCTATIIKMINNVVNASKIKKMLMSMQEEWSNLKAGPVHDIMLKYANEGYRYTVLYNIYLYLGMLTYLLMPIRPKLMELLGLSKIPSEWVFVWPVDYWVENNMDYFFYIEFHMVLGTFFILTVLSGIDTLYIVFAQHACGLFVSISYRLENIPIPPMSDINIHVEKEKDEAYLIISDCIKQHNKAIEFTETLKKVNMWSFFFIVGINVVLITFSGIQIMANANNIDEVLKFVPWTVGQILHIFVESIFSQQLMNHSSHIGDSISMMKWYGLSLKARKLLCLINMRSRVVCKMSAGPFFDLSVQFFATVIKTSMSYFTVYRSMQMGKLESETD